MDKKSWDRKLGGFPGVHKIEFSIDPKTSHNNPCWKWTWKNKYFSCNEMVLHKTLPAGINGKELIDKGIAIKEKSFAKVSMVISQEDDDDEDLVKEQDF